MPLSLKWIATLESSLLFPPYEVLARPIRILTSEIFQCVFEGFMRFLCGSDSKIQTA